MSNQVPVLTNPLIPNAYTIARSRFKSVISQERHALLKKSSSIDHFDYDSDLEDILREVPMRQKLDFETSLACRKPGYNLKLFDRYIDVTPFREESSLYPICREWIKNHPDSKKPSTEKVYGKEESTRKKESDNTEEIAIHELPAPKALPYDMHGNPIRIRIPGVLTSLRIEDAHDSIWDFFDRKSSDENKSLPPPAVLFQAHLDRWNRVKKRWRLAAKADDRRYKKSFDVIQAAFRDTPPQDS